MVSEFLVNNRTELIARCIEKIIKRPRRAATERQLLNGVQLFFDQLTRALSAEQSNAPCISLAIPGSDTAASTETSLCTSMQGKALFHLGYSVEHVVQDHSDLCQAIMDLAFERGTPFSIEENQALNRCLNNALAAAVSALSAQREAAIRAEQTLHENEQLGFLMHELRNALAAASLAVDAMEMGNLPLAGKTGNVLKRSHASMNRLINKSLDEVTAKSAGTGPQQRISLASFIADAKTEADLKAAMRGCHFTVGDVDPLLDINVNHDLMLAALMNLLHNAFKFTHQHTQVTLEAYAIGERVLIDVKDQCGGLPPGDAEKMFTPFTQHSDDKTGMGLGLSIARKTVEADGGILSVKDMPGTGCVFTIDLPRYSLR